MEIVLFIPGIFGSRLYSPDAEVWPPTPIEALTGYKRIGDLLRTDLTPGGVIESACVDVYGSVLNALRNFGYNEGDANRRLVPYAYDWRRDIVSVANELDAVLVQLVENYPDAEIKLLCHSMGGLVARACLEGPDAGARPWARAIRLAVFLATPHEGAPLAFARATGVGGSALGLHEADWQRLAAVPGYPAAYQLFPPANIEPVWDFEDLTPFKARSLFEPGLVAPFQLNPDHLRAATAFHSSINWKRKPVGCRYFAVASAAHETITRFNQELGVANPVKVRASGDGTVPILSAAALPIQTALVEANHLGVPQKPVTHRMLGMLLGSIPPGPVIAGDQAPNLSISDRAISEGETVEIIINVPQIERLKVVIQVRRDRGEGRLEDVLEIPVKVETPGLTGLQLSAPYLSVGRYEFDLVVGDKRTDREELLVSRHAPT